MVVSIITKSIPIAIVKTAGKTFFKLKSLVLFLRTFFFCFRTLFGKNNTVVLKQSQEKNFLLEVFYELISLNHFFDARNDKF